ncbi:unnamed protein product [Pleuronectes platessa]|uniref:Uncharacterized protein n=1 Tax=Pleuronectes platessa TaxID=8262 RepID=A0A9N7UNV8_PLEPL|nr:unnamed protein product [Pleuronectes platessa]
MEESNARKHRALADTFLASIPHAATSYTFPCIEHRPGWCIHQQGSGEMRQREEGGTREKRSGSQAKERWHSYSPICQSDYLARYRAPEPPQIFYNSKLVLRNNTTTAHTHNLSRVTEAEGTEDGRGRRSERPPPSSPIQ